MKPQELKDEFDSIACSFLALSKKLEALQKHVNLNADKKVISELVSELHWAAENSTVIGLHQINKALEDNLGSGLAD